MNVTENDLSVRRRQCHESKMIISYNISQVINIPRLGMLLVYRLICSYFSLSVDKGFDAAAKSAVIDFLDDENQR